MDREELRFRLTCEARKTRRPLRRRDPTLAGSAMRDLAAALIRPRARSIAARADPRSAVVRSRPTARCSQALRHARLVAGRSNRQARAELAGHILHRFPGARRDAARARRSHRRRPLRPARLSATCGSPSPPDWHADPIHQTPRTASSTGRPSPISIQRTGDHKIIWELNRHQHWLTLGRAYWLTGDRRYRDSFVAQLESWLAGEPAADRHQLGEHARARVPVDVLDLGARILRRGRRARRRPPWLVDLLLALDRQLTHVEQNLSRYFSPNTHLLGEALALYVVRRRFRSCGAAARGRTIGRTRPPATKSTPDRAPTAATPSSRRTTTATRLDFYLLALMVATRVRMTRPRPRSSASARPGGVSAHDRRRSRAAAADRR